MLDHSKWWFYNLLPKFVNILAFLESPVGFFIYVCIFAAPYSPETYFAGNTFVSFRAHSASCLVVIIPAFVLVFIGCMKLMPHRTVVGVFFGVVCEFI